MIDGDQDIASIKPAQNGGADLDSLLAEYVAGTRGGATAPAGETSPPSYGTNNGGTYLDDIVDPNSQLLRQREQDAYTHRLNEEALNRLTELQTTEERVRREEAHRAHTRDLADLVKSVKGDSDEDEEIVQAWIDIQARENPEFQNIWLARAENPQLMKAVEKQLGREYAKRAARRPDHNATEDREMIAQVIRNGSRGGYPPEQRAPEFGRMSNEEYRREVRERYGFEAGV